MSISVKQCFYLSTDQPTGQPTNQGANQPRVGDSTEHDLNQVGRAPPNYKWLEICQWTTVIATTTGGYPKIVNQQLPCLEFLATVTVIYVNLC